MMKAKFGDAEFQWIEGYKISAGWVPRSGFRGNFFVYLWERIEAATPFKATPNLTKDGPGQRAALQLSDEDHTYKFDKIDAVSAQLGATRQERYRIFEFRYDKGESEEVQPNVSVANKNKRDLEKTALGDEYKFSISGSSQHLLGFRSRVAASGANVFRFSSLRTDSNSFIEKMMELNDQNVQQKKMTDFTIKFTQGEIKVTQENLNAMYVDESWGSFTKIPPASLLDITGDTPEQEHVRLNLDDFSPHSLMQRDAHHEHHEENFRPDTVQTLTLVFKPGIYQDFKIK